MFRIRLALSLFLLGLLAHGQSPEEPFLTEPFDHAPFNPLNCLSTGGTGWAGAWERVTGDDVILRAQDLGESGSPDGTHCAVEFVRAGIRYNRPIPRIEDDGRELWISIFMNFRPGGNPNSVGNITLLRDGDQVFTFGRKFGNQRFGLVWPGATQYNTDVPTEGHHWVVVKIQFSGDNGEEQAWLWIDPDPTVVPSVDTAALAVPQSGLPALRLNNGIDAVQIKCEGSAPLKMDLDELRFGRSFGAVSPLLVDAVFSEETSEDWRVTIAPNPASSYLTIDWRLPGRRDLVTQIHDATGRRVYSSAAIPYPAGEHRQRIDLDPLNLASGWYVVSMRDAEVGWQRLLLVR